MSFDPFSSQVAFAPGFPPVSTQGFLGVAGSQPGPYGSVQGASGKLNDAGSFVMERQLPSSHPFSAAQGSSMRGMQPFATGAANSIPLNVGFWNGQPVSDARYQHASTTHYQMMPIPNAQQHLASRAGILNQGPVVRYDPGRYFRPFSTQMAIGCYDQQCLGKSHGYQLLHDQQKQAQMCRILEDVDVPAVYWKETAKHSFDLRKDEISFAQKYRSCPRSLAPGVSIAQLILQKCTIEQDCAVAFPGWKGNYVVVEDENRPPARTIIIMKCQHGELTRGGLALDLALLVWARHTTKLNGDADWAAFRALRLLSLYRLADTDVWYINCAYPVES